MSKEAKAKSSEESKFKEIEKTEESDLEEEVEEQEINIDENKFQEFFQQEDFSPVLEKIQGPQEHLDLEQVAESAPTPEKFNEEDDFKYIKSAEQGDEPKYHNSESISYENVQNVGRVDMDKIQIDPLERRKTQFAASETRTPESSTVENYVAPKQVEIQKLGTQHPLEKKEVKYKPSR